jgi:AAA domain (dynein-related subfamily)
MSIPSITLKPSELAGFLAVMIPAGKPVLIMGPPGVGKSDIVAQAAAQAGAKLQISHPGIADPTDYKGMPWIDREADHAEFKPFGDFYHALKSKGPFVWFLDDLGQAPPSVQNGVMQLVLNRGVNGHRLPKDVVFVAATNRRSDRAGVSGMLSPLISRFTIIELRSDLDDWCAWAQDSGMPSHLVGFLRFRPDLLSDAEFAKAAQDMRPYACPRSWAAVGELMELPIPSASRLAGYAGRVGQGPAGELLAYLKVVEAMPDIDTILAEPEKAPIPTEAQILYAVSAGLAVRTTPANFGAVAKYCQRLHTAKPKARSEFAALALRDAYRRLPALITHKDFIALANTSLGKLLTQDQAGA